MDIKIAPAYYKIQEYDKKSLSWVDIQKSYPTYQEAYDEAFGHQGIDFRIMKIFNGKRGVVNEN